MKYDMNLLYVSDTGIDVNIEASAEGVVVWTKDGDVKNHFSLSAQDAVELSNMLAQTSQHVRVLNNKN